MVFSTTLFSIALVGLVSAQINSGPRYTSYCSTTTTTSTICPTATPGSINICPRPTLIMTVVDVITTRPLMACPGGAAAPTGGLTVTIPIEKCLTRTVPYNTTLPCSKCSTIPIVETVTKTSTMTISTTCPPIPHITPTATFDATRPCPPPFPDPVGYFVCMNATFTSEYCPPAVPTPTDMYCLYHS